MQIYIHTSDSDENVAKSANDRQEAYQGQKSSLGAIRNIESPWWQSCMISIHRYKSCKD